MTDEWEVNISFDKSKHVHERNRSVTNGGLLLFSFGSNENPKDLGDQCIENIYL